MLDLGKLLNFLVMSDESTEATKVQHRFENGFTLCSLRNHSYHPTKYLSFVTFHVCSQP